MFGRLDGETEDEYKARILPLMTAGLLVPRLRAEEQRKVAQDVDVPVTSSALVFGAGLSLSITPAKLGELVKSYLLREMQAPDGGFYATTRALLPVFPDLTEEERWRSTFALVPPTLCLGTAPDQAFYFIITPKTFETIDVEITPRAGAGALTLRTKAFNNFDIVIPVR